MATKLYKARWESGCRTVGSVDFKARSDYEAKQMADKIAREINLTRTPRIIMCEGVMIECIQTGVSG